MNLLWNRESLAENGIHNDPEHGVRSRSFQWAEIILERLCQPDDLAKQIRLAFPHVELAEIFETFDIHHVPGRSLKILGRFLSPAEEKTMTIVQVNFYSASDIQDKFNQVKVEAIDSSRIALLEAWQGIVRIFPEDAGLPGLGAMLDLSRVARLLGESEADARAADWQMLSYQSGKRCALSYHFHRSGTRYFGKIQDEKRAEMTHKRLCLLWDDPRRRFQMARPIAYDAELGACWESFVDGQNLEKALATGELDALVELVISNLVYLHEQNLPDLSDATPEKILAFIERKILRRMQSLVPELACRAEKCFRRLHEHIAWAQGNPTVTLHGDFHIANFILNQDGLVFIDLDTLCKGDPCVDLAWFGSRLILRNLHHSDRLPETLALVAQLPALYSGAGGRPVRQQTFAWYLAALMIARQIKTCIRVDAPEKTTLISKLLDWAEDSLNCAEKPVIRLR